jgi:hypothetical protein
MKKIIIVLLCFGFVNLFSEEQDLFEVSEKNSDASLICFKYKFKVGDTLIYNVLSYDSIAINYEKPILKTRLERIEITCDSIKKGIFYLSQRLIDFKSKESSADTTGVERNDTPWMKRKSWLAIDSSGRRHALGYEDSAHAAISPGGAFQPYLFIGLGEGCQAVDKTWNYNSLDELVENAFPVPLERQSSLFRVLENIDTLGYICNRLSFIKTAQGSYQVNSGEDNYKITNIVNGYGTMDFSVEKSIPVHFLVTAEQKLQITIGDDEPIPGWHYIFSYFTLIDYKEGQIKSNNKQKNKKNK